MYLNSYVPFEKDVTSQSSSPGSLLMTFGQDEGFGFGACVFGLWIQWWNGVWIVLKAEDDGHASHLGRHG